MLVHNANYIFEFDARATGDKIIEPIIQQYNPPYNDYSQIGFLNISPSEAHYKFSFEMEYATDNNAQIIFNIGGSEVDIYVDNISVMRDGTSGVNESDLQVPYRFALEGNYPNPFNTGTTISFSVSEKAIITIDLYDITGKFITNICSRRYQNGSHTVDFNGSNLSSGVYICHMNVKIFEGMKEFNDTHKIVLLK